MAKMISLTIDGIRVEAPEGTVIVDAAKMVGIDIPVFCYHPKMEPVGMCRMCLVEVGRPAIDRATGQPLLQADGTPQIQFGAKLETACTTPISEGMVVLGATDKAKAGREDILEFLLTSHPLDCPICDKGGECPLQNLTMGFGPGQSRYLYSEKKHLAKHVPLGDLIFLDRERCIQCARCVRFQDTIADDPVLGFSQRGRSFEIITSSEPGFDSYWSGNTTDICPVGALTTTDFRFRARPWELKSAASICNHCPVGCNLTLNLRREVTAGGGDWVVKRVMPRQNEAVNEIWICDKGRFAYHYASKNSNRLTQPLVRKNGELQAATWKEALDLVAERFGEVKAGLVTLAGGRLANEDLFNLRELTEALGGKALLYTHMGGGELTTQLGLPPGSNLGDLGKDSVVLVVGCDLEEEAPIWWLRVHGAVKRGAELITLNARQTKLDRDAAHVLRYPYGNAAAAALALGNVGSPKRPDLPESINELARSAGLKAAAAAIAGAKDLVIIYGSDGMGPGESRALAQACANLLLTSDHFGRANNGLIAAWPRANDQGAWEIGWQPAMNLKAEMEAAAALYIAAADPVGDDAAYQSVFGGDKFVVVQELYLSATARLADVVLPVQSWVEREGSYTNGERRVQRFYPALAATLALPQMVESPGTRRAELLTAIRPEMEGPLPDFAIPAYLAKKLGQPPLELTAVQVFDRLAAEVPVFAGLSYKALAEVHEQWPIVGRADMYYGGTGYANKQGLGRQLPLAEAGGSLLSWPQTSDFKLPRLGAVAFPITRLYDCGSTMEHARVLENRIGEAFIVISQPEAARLKLNPFDLVRITFSETGQNLVVQTRIDASLPERVVLAPRSFGLPLSGPTAVELRPAM